MGPAVARPHTSSGSTTRCCLRRGEGRLDRQVAVVGLPLVVDRAVVTGAGDGTVRVVRPVRGTRKVGRVHACPNVSQVAARSLPKPPGAAGWLAEATDGTASATSAPAMMKYFFISTPFFVAIPVIAGSLQPAFR